MSRKTHSHKRSYTKRSPKQKPSRESRRKYDWRTKIVAGAIAVVLLAGGTFAHWRAKRDEVLIAKNTPNSVKNISTASERDQADIPPEVLSVPPVQPPMPAGYNAHSGGLPPGALPPGVSLPGLTMAQGYGVDDGIRQQFTGKERDRETGLDYFGSRYYSSQQGRFTSPDEVQSNSQAFAMLGKGHPTKQALPYADLNNPQSLNRYSYALNNPLRYKDQDGHIPVETAIDVISFAYSFYELIRNPSWGNLGYVIWDGLAAVVPYAPGSWVAKVGRYGYQGLRAQGIVNKLDDFETVVNNKFIREGVGLVGQGDNSVRQALGMRQGEAAADFLGVKKGGEYVIAEAKASDIGRAVEQLDNTARALVGKQGDVKFSAEVVLRQGQKLDPGFRVSGNQLEKFNVNTQKWELQKAYDKAITVRYQ